MKKMIVKGIVIVAAVMMMFGLTSSPVSAYYSYGNSKDTNICNHGSCKSKRMTGSSYCSAHTCYESGCYREVGGRNERCATHKGAAYPSSGKSSYSKTYSNHSYSSKKKDEYNASDYDDYEDFYEDYYDDFDGIDDAEDYWEEHH